MTSLRNLKGTYGGTASPGRSCRVSASLAACVNPLTHGFTAEPDPVLRFHLATVGLNLGSALRFHLVWVGLNPIGAGLAPLANGFATETYSILPFHIGGFSFLTVVTHKLSFLPAAKQTVL